MTEHVPNPEGSPAMTRILAALARTESLSVFEISRAAFVATTTLSGGGYLDKLKSMGLIHVSGWRKNSNGFTTPLYSLGHAVDYPQPLFDADDRDSDGMARIVAVLEKLGPLTYRQIATAAGVSPNTIRNARYMEILVVQERAHICNWRRNRHGPLSAIYAAGKGRNVEKPPPLSAAEKSQRHRRGQSGTRGASAWTQAVVSLQPAVP